jgi:hypothetical protein
MGYIVISIISSVGEEKILEQQIFFSAECLAGIRHSHSYKNNRGTDIVP